MNRPVILPTNAMPFSWMGRTLLSAGRRGLKADPLVRSAGIAMQHEGPLDEACLDPAEYMLMCGVLIQAVDDEMHDTTRSRMRIGTAAMGTSVVAGAKTLEGAIDTLVRFFDVAGTYCLLGKERIGDDLLLTIRLDVKHAHLSALVEEMTATYLHAVLSFFLGFPLQVAAFHTVAPDHPNLGAQHPYLRCPIGRSATTAMRIRQDQLLLPRGQSILEGRFVDCIYEWATGFGPAAARFSNEASMPVSAMLFRQLLKRDADFTSCCRLLMMNARDLTHALVSEGTTYRHVRREAILERARPFLATDTGTDDIAEALGYSDARSLRRAVKLAGGGTIGAMRQSLRAGSSANKSIVFEALRHHYAQIA